MLDGHSEIGAYVRSDLGHSYFPSICSELPSNISTINKICTKVLHKKVISFRIIKQECEINTNIIINIELSGSPTIRAYGREESFINENEHRIDENQVCYYPAIVSNR